LALATFLLDRALKELPGMTLVLAVGVTTVIGRTVPGVVACIGSAVILASWGVGPGGVWPDAFAGTGAIAAFLVVSLTIAVALPRVELSRLAERRKAMRSAFLAGASVALESAPNSRDALRRLAAYVVPELADWCVLHVAEGDAIEQVAVAHDDPRKLAMVEEFQRRQPIDPDAATGVPQVIRTGAREYYRDVIQEAAKVGADADALELIEALGLRSAIIVPLNAKGKTMGALTLVTSDGDSLFEAEDVDFANELASRAASAVQILDANDRLRRASTRNDILQRLATDLSTAISPEEVVGVVIDRGAREVGASAALVALLSADGRTLTVSGQLGFDHEVVGDWQSFAVAAPLPLSEAVRQRRCVWIGSQQERDQRYPALSGLPLRADHATICAPMIAGAGVVGGITLMVPEAAGYAADDEGFFLAIASQSGQAIRRASLYEAERSSAEVLQRSLLPENLPTIKGISMVARYWPAEPYREVGGDFYDVLPTADGAVALIGDVCGRGIEAAALTGMARHAAWAAVDLDASPSDVLRRVNDVLVRHVHDLRFVTMCVARMEPRTDGTIDITVSLGGHPHAIVGSADAVRPIGEPGTLLGVLDSIEVSDRTWHLARSEVLLLYTDGLIERGGHHLPFDEDLDLIAASRSAPHTPSAVAGAIAEVVVGSGPLEDDGALLVIGADASEGSVPGVDTTERSTT
jgi:GAF domain-containing protein